MESPDAVFVNGSVYFDGVYEISSNRLTIVASKGLTLVNIDRFSGELNLLQYLNQDTRNLRYILDSECESTKPLF